MHVIVVHGGASINPCIDATAVSNYNEAIIECVKKGYQVLDKGGTSIDAVEAAVRELEDIPYFNAGTGCCLTSTGTVELDAMIMNGADAKLGAVGCVDCTDHPISLARLVMEQSPHCMFVGNGAKEFAKSKGFQLIDSPDVLITQKARQDLGKYKNFKVAVDGQMNVKSMRSSDTVGAVALDMYGNLACATSTGGICGKLPGRIGDAPLVGCGGYANEYGAASCTGHGESLMRMMCCKSVVDKIERGETAYQAAIQVLDHIYNKTQSCGGVICLDKHGSVGVYNSAEFMSWAVYSSTDGLSSFNKTS